ncbi:hypothetical protein [Streptomyces mirabilis]|uniref:Uncharacterized protein n=2 Tax=Streptomyces TaxID=1883 RepID=A0ABU3V1A1_9ACTN|nr:hypothetical protein [Streptomyces mirabilis]MCX4614683.1 hypothetical protein [Streptomyces mirabilis]MCX5346642.1 hypothetical protein [Streptomyces mirabilis]MDU8999956.1 hypothetical protein [Streptomyces mirabilis]
MPISPRWWASGFWQEFAATGRVAAAPWRLAVHRSAPMPGKRLTDHVALAFTTRVLGVDVVVEDLDLRALRKPWPFRESRAGSGRGR